MQPNTKKIALVIGALFLGASAASNAATTSMNLTVNTISDVSINEVTGLDFGTFITTTALGVCTMDADLPSPATVFSDGIPGTTMTGVGYGVLTGANCVGTGVTVATPGVYSISGAPGLSVNVAYKSEVQVGDYTFIPQGCAVNNDKLATTTDSCDPVLGDGAAVLVDIADVLDGAPAVAGFTHFTVGGALTVGATPLASDLDQNVTFLVDVIY